ncbi:hypothetical protein [Magnetovibrio sp.]|uniref:hypothetical protein n=1 Tax=Magnetovibrio sp. TaxID=2024836 RepID=UPI002F9206B0
MFDFFDGENAVWFYAVPFAVFAPIYFSFVWHIGVKNLFRVDEEKRERKRLQREHLERINKRREAKAGTRQREAHAATMPSKYWIAQAAVYGLFMAVVGVFSAYPTYSYLGAGEAQIKLNLSHPGQRVEACVKRTKEELAALPPNMRAKMKCSRERSAVLLELEMDGELLFKGEAKATGLRSDGASSFYKKFFIAAGTHRMTVRMNDGDPSKPYTHEQSAIVDVKPTQNLIVGFHENDHVFYFK